MKFLNIITLIVILTGIYFIIYSIYNFCNNLDAYYYNNINYNKTLLLIGGIHGNEQSGSAYLLKLNQQFYNNEISIPNTRVIILPHVNKCGIMMNLRNILFFTDINRNFTDDTTSNINIKILEYVKIIKETDLIVDIHEGYDFHRMDYNSIGSTLYASTEYANNIINIIYDPLNNTITDPLKKFKLLTHDSNLVKKDTIKYSLMVNNTEGTLDYYTYINNINYILIEITGQKNIQPMELRLYQLTIIFAEIFKYIQL